MSATEKPEDDKERKPLLKVKSPKLLYDFTLDNWKLFIPGYKRKSGKRTSTHKYMTRRNKPNADPAS